MEFTFDFIRLFFYGLFLASPILILLLLIIILLGQYIGKHENWSRYDSLYWSFITATTVGYGDLPPSKKLSKAFAIIIAFTGLITAGIIVAIAVDSVLESFKAQRDASELYEIKTTIESKIK